MPRGIRRTLLILAVLVFAYPAVGNVLILTGVAQTLANLKPEKLAMRWDSAWTLIPGHFTVEGLRFQSTTPRNQFQLVVDSGQVEVSLIGFLSRTVNITKATGHGVEVDYAKVLPESSSTAGQDPGAASTNGSENMANAVPNTGETTVGTKPPWTIKLAQIKATGIRNVNIRNLSGVDDMQFLGDGQLDNLQMSLVTKGGLMQVDRAVGTMTVHSQDGIQNQTQPLRVTADIAIASHRPREHQGREKMRFFSGRIGAQGNFASIGAVSFLPDRNLNLSVSGEGLIDTLIILDHGEVKSGSRLTFQSDHLASTFLDLRSVGHGTIQASVDDSRDRSVDIKIDVDQFKLLKENSDIAYLEGDDLVISAQVPRLMIHHQEIEENSAFSFDIREGRVSDVTYYNEFIAPTAGLKFIAGSAKTTGGLSIVDGIANGRIEITGTDVTFSARDRAIKADLKLVANLSEGDYENKTFRLGDTSLRLDNVQIETQARETDDDWWGEILFERGQLVWGKPMQFGGKMSLRMRDVEPLIAMVRDPAKKETRLDEFLNVKDVQGRLLILSQDEELSINPLHIDSQGLEVIAKFELSREFIDGRLYAKFKKIAANFEIVDRKPKILGFGGRKQILEEINLSVLDQ